MPKGRGRGPEETLPLKQKERERGRGETPSKQGGTGSREHPNPCFAPHLCPGAIMSGVVGLQENV